MSLSTVTVRLFLLLCCLHFLLGSTAAEQDATHDATGGEHHEEEAEPAFAVLFPWFVEAVGVFVFFVLTRTFHQLPYTAVMFVVGTIMGIGATEANLTDQHTESILQWNSINSEVLLLVFLPGLLFRDALHVNFYLFQKSVSQIMVMAFPMVLAGTCLTALVGFYIFPYNWSWNLSMTVGSILCATDPVAVAALLNEVGAPPRLKMHISGESMFNDGSAMVFYTIFSALYLHESGLPGGKEVNLKEGVAIFCRMAGGGAAVGIAFGLGLISILALLNRRLNNEENVVQVAATISVAYLSFYAAEVSSSMSGVISVVCCGITTRAFAGGLINNPEMMENFWILLEHLLNTLLFALGGVVWGTVITRDYWTGTDWGYMFLLYVLLQAIRALLVLCFYPILSRIGLKTNPQESIFVWWGGLRGAVGIALAISLDSEVWADTAGSTVPEDLKAQEETSTLFGMVGGIAFLTLIINGTTAGPVLRKLGLANSTEMRKRVIECFEGGLKKHILDLFVDHMTDPRFDHVDFALVRYHVPLLADVTVDELRRAMYRHKEEMPPKHYKAPHFEYILPHLFDPNASQAEKDSIATSLLEVTSTKDTATPSHESIREALPESTDKERTPIQENLTTPDSLAVIAQHALELRLVFIELVRTAYTTMVNHGEIDARQYDGILIVSLEESLDFAAADVAQGKPLKDFEYLNIDFNGWVQKAKRKVQSGRNKAQGTCCGSAVPVLASLEKLQAGLDVTRAFAFIYAHNDSQEKFRTYFTESGIPIPSAERLVLDESAAQVRMAEALVNAFDEKMVKVTLSHLLCNVLLNSGARYIEALLEAGLLSEREGGGYLEEIEKNIHGVSLCGLEEHPEELSKEERNKILDKTKDSLVETMEDGEIASENEKYAETVMQGLHLRRGRRSSVPEKLL